ncbi:hypothetical protein PG996_009348 [Apiospora saccharicola]|uniref:MalT-like TPR region domain-containing protein n=1 Tax=Apiospora saccharicola TaxID=335842 RepID=A0ABR1UNE8_9PEZI
MSLKKYAEAEVAFRRCLKVWEACPGDPSIYIPHLGICLMLQGKLEEAETILLELIAKRAEKHGDRDRTSFRDTLQEALQIYQSSSEFKNEEARAWFKLSEIAAKRGMKEEAQNRRMKAEELRCAITRRNTDAVATEEDYDESIMFWSR